MFSNKKIDAQRPIPSNPGWGRVLDFVLPHLCARCRAPMEHGQSLCSECWPKLQFITRPQCRQCGVPFGFDLGDATLCGRCIEHKPDYAMARAALRYTDDAKPMILAFKHGDKTHLRLLLARLLRQASADVLRGADIIAPVPLHWMRLLRRKYNQAALLSAEIAAQSRLPHIPDLLIRQRRTTPHQNMNRAEREKNVRAAFTISDKHLDKVKNNVIVIVDDVFTTGATVDECARALLKHRAREVRVLTLARVCHDT